MTKKGDWIRTVFLIFHEFCFLFLSVLPRKTRVTSGNVPSRCKVRVSLKTAKALPSLQWGHNRATSKSTSEVNQENNVFIHIIPPVTLLLPLTFTTPTKGLSLQRFLLIWRWTGRPLYSMFKENTEYISTIKYTWLQLHIFIENRTCPIYRQTSSYKSKTVHAVTHI